MDLTLLKQFVDANKLGGWTRAAVASLLGLLIAKWPLLSSFLDPTTQSAIGVAVSGIIVGIWSQMTKTPEAKIAAVEALPEVAKIVVAPIAANAIAAAAADPTRPKVTT